LVDCTSLCPGKYEGREESKRFNIASCVGDDGGGFQLHKPREKGWTEGLIKAAIA